MTSLSMLVLAGCAPSAPAAQPLPDAPATPSAQSQYVEDASDYMLAVRDVALPTPTPMPEAETEDTRIFVVVATEGVRANLRSAPSLAGEIVGKGNPGTTYEVVGRSADGEWFQICCVEGVSTAGDAAPVTTAAAVQETDALTDTAGLIRTVILTATDGVTVSIDLTVSAGITESAAITEGDALTQGADITESADITGVTSITEMTEAATVSTLPNTAWIAASLVTVGGDPEDVAVVEDVPVEDALLPGDLAATWSVDWECGSDRERCKLQECTANVAATTTGDNGAQWLSIDHVVEWDEACSEFPPDQWTFEVDRFSGEERTGEFDDKFLYSYWVGENAGEFNGVYTLDDGRKIAVWCSGPYKVELNEGNGWTSVYQGNTCHDVRTGMLVLLSYTKRWLYTGEFDGNTYDSAYFGDSETLVQRLRETNVEVAEVVSSRQ